MSSDDGAAWTAAMRRGEFSRAWDISDRVLARRVAQGRPRDFPPRHEQWIWDGRPFDGRRVLVRCYHGLGDTLQFARFLPPLARRASELTVWAQPELIPLLRTLDVGRLLPLHDGAPGVEADVECEIMELSHALRIAPSALELPAFDVAAAPRMSERFGLGVMPQAGAWDPRRSIPLESFAPLRALPGVELFDLRPGAAGAAEVVAAASRVRSLDLILTVDTMMAHLAGSLGAPTWTLLPADADWRWMEGRTDSPWYPTMRLFRQRRPGDWDGVMEEVAAALRQAAP
jgi:hypothetical protein